MLAPTPPSPAATRLKSWRRASNASWKVRLQAEADSETHVPRKPVPRAVEDGETRVRAQLLGARVRRLARLPQHRRVEPSELRRRPLRRHLGCGAPGPRRRPARRRLAEAVVLGDSAQQHLGRAAAREATGAVGERRGGGASWAVGGLAVGGTGRRPVLAPRQDARERGPVTAGAARGGGGGGDPEEKLRLPDLLTQLRGV